MSSPVPAKTQQLHNFSLPQLKWNNNNNNNLHHQRRRRTAESPPHRHWSPIRESAQDDHHDAEKSEKDSILEKDSKTKIFIRLKKTGKVAESASDENESGDQVPKKDEIQVEKEKDEIQVENCENEELEEPKTWNLRPRRAAKKVMNAENRGIMKAQENRSTSVGEKKEKKPKFSISLTLQEIEDDFLLMTGSKPPRKPKKRTKNVQKQLNAVFPGLYLSSVTPDCYKVPDPPTRN